MMRLMLLTLSIVVVSHHSHAQFNKYRSRTKTPQSGNSQNADAGFDNGQQDPLADNLDTPSNEDITFGKRAKKSGVGKPEFVKLNPETAFGPEIITTFDFSNADIMDLTKHMQKLTGINLILDKNVKGKVTITAPTPITVGDAWRAYLTALNMSGYTLVKSGAFYKIINARDVRYTPTKIYTGQYAPDTENYIMKVIALKNISATELARNFRPFMSRYGRIIDIKQTNTIIVTDTGTNIARLSKLVKFLDVPGYEEGLQIIPVRNSSAQEIAKLLKTLTKTNSRGSRRNRNTKTSQGSGIGEIIAEPRTNSIIAMATADGAKKLRQLIKKLDVKTVASSAGRVHVYYLKHGDSEGLSKTLSTLVTNAKPKTTRRSSRFSRNTQQQQSNAIFSAEVKITSDKNNNALVVTASPTDWLTLKDVIDRLDIPRDQVYVEGLIMETRMTRARAFGVSYAGAYGLGSTQRAGFATSDVVNLAGGNITNISGLFVGTGNGPIREISLGGNTVKVNSVSGLIKAVASNQDTNVLATPQILALDNTEASFEVGSTVPIRSSVTNANGTTETTNNGSQKIALVLKLTPQINKVTRFVKLKIDQRIDDFDGDQTGSTDGLGVATRTRSAITEVVVRDRDTIAMGGLIRDRRTTNLEKVPVLGDIPVLGWLFKNKSKTVEKVNLLFFLTPKILAPYETTAADNTRELLQRRRENLETFLDRDVKDPYKETADKLEKQAERQKKGPLYDLKGSDRYKRINRSSVGQDAQASAADVPNYKEIVLEAKKSR